ncbi:hypothetical protein QFC22_000500 [Naganishia vaughanmartiniae]|uniref:Uncharacterized protein n=1 Tax=Naganishia vaughanmartiniae TaxID=1424756 RepID=A0ACC2XQ19_9TREE|nr:hypothetical protein QFC22_000500 [Naganishia vaughanmartiniae]
MAQQQTRSDKQPVEKESKRPRIQPAPYFGYPTGKAVPLNNNSTLFEGMTFYVRCDFPDLYLAQFIRDIETLGGSTNVTNAWEANYIINNPPETDAQWQLELGRRVKTENISEPPIQRPYHWIYACHHAGDIVPKDELPSYPVFTKWDHVHQRPVPLLVYVTVNLPRHGDEDVNGALCAVEAMLETNGGFRSATRSHADVLLLNLNTAAGRKFQAEAKPDQVIWSRDQFEEFAAGSRSLDLGRDQHPHEVVIARTNTRSVSAAPPRRTTRKEFTAEDDDLIIRYIAVLDPEKKRMASKSFYNELMNSSDPNVIPWVDRHTAESWRERVRKRQAPFKLRVDAYRHEDIDGTLCTREERESGTIPAGLRKEPTVSRNPAASVPVPVEQDGESSVDGKARESREATVEKSISSDQRTAKKRKQSTETVTGPERGGPTNKKRKTSRRGMMPIDSQLRASPPSAAEAGPSRQRNENRAAPRLKPRKSAEEDVFDHNWDSPSSDAPAVNNTKPAAKRKQATEKPDAPTNQYLAPASSPPPTEPLKRTRSFIALERAMDGAIQEDSAAEGDPDTDDAELENDLHKSIVRNQQSIGRAENGDPAQTRTSRRMNDNQATGMTMSQPSISQVPDTQAHFTEGEMTELLRIQNPVQREPVNDFPVIMTGRIHLDSVQIQGLPVALDAAVGQIQPLTIDQLQAGSSAETPKRNGQNGHEETSSRMQGSGDQQTIRAPTLESKLSGRPRSISREQTDREKRDELARIVAGLKQEYGLQYTAVERLILECRKRHQCVNQPLLRALIEEAVAAEAQE